MSIVNISLLLDMAADGFGDRVLVGRRAAGLTAARLRALSIGGARLIRAAGADSVVYLGVNGPAFPVALFAAARAGVPLVPVSYRLGGQPLGALLANHPRALGLAGPDETGPLQAAGLTALTFGDWLRVAAEGGPGDGSHRCGTSKSSPNEGGPDQAGPDDPDRAEAEPQAPAVLIYTSGTTSAPKGVLVKHSNLLAYVFGTVDFGSAGETEAALVSVPPYHIAAVANAVTNLYAGRRTVVLEQFTPAEWVALVRAEQITNALVVPTMLARVIEEADAEVPSLRALAYGGAPMPAAVIERALRRWPRVDFVNAYGLTETSSTIAVLGPEDHRAALASADPAVRARLGSAGRPVPGLELVIRDAAGTGLPPGESGRIWVRGDQVSGQYAGSGSAVDAGGWFDTRDQGYLDADGYLFIGGRADDTIIRGAENIAPAEIEDVLLAHPAVADAVVVGVPDEEWGQRIEAAVVLRAAATVEPGQLREHVRGRLRGSRTPDRIEIWTEIPRTETGKVVRRQALQKLISPAG
jgi:acyl-CoA synthetase (AMP-forming)/AMP-acid ligase II